MKKIIALAVIALVFLTPAAKAWAGEQPILQAPSDYKVTEVATVPNATSFALSREAGSQAKPDQSLTGAKISGGDTQFSYIFSEVFGPPATQASPARLDSESVSGRLLALRAGKQNLNKVVKVSAAGESPVI